MDGFKDDGRTKDDSEDRVFLRPRPVVNPLIARWRFLKRLVATGEPAQMNGKCARCGRSPSDGSEPAPSPG